MLKKSAIIITLLLTVCFSADKIRISIMDLKATAGIEPSLAAQISSILRNEISGTKRFTVVALESMDKVLQEQVRQHSGCTDQSCAVKIGNLLNVQKMIVGTIGRIGGIYEIRVNFINVEQGDMELSEKVQAKSEAELSTVSEILAKKIAAKVGLQGKVLSVEDEGQYLCNIGKQDGVKVGDVLQVIRMGKAIVDEETGEFYGRKQEKIGQVKIKEFQGPKLSLIEDVKWSTVTVKKGDRLVIEGRDLKIGLVSTPAGAPTRPLKGQKVKRRSYKLGYITEVNDKMITMDLGSLNRVKKRFIYTLTYKGRKITRAEVKRLDPKVSYLKTRKTVDASYSQNTDASLRLYGRRKILTIGFLAGAGSFKTEIPDTTYTQRKGSLGGAVSFHIHLPLGFGLKTHLGFWQNVQKYNYSGVRTIRDKSSGTTEITNIDLTLVQRYWFPTFAMFSILPKTKVTPFLGLGFAYRREIEAISGSTFLSDDEIVDPREESSFVFAWTIGIDFFRVKGASLMINLMGLGRNVTYNIGVGINI